MVAQSGKHEALSKCDGFVTKLTAETSTQRISAEVTIGATQVKVRVIGVALTAVAIAAGAPVHAATLYSTGFEPPDYTTGQLDGQNGWFNDPNAFVQTSTVESGTQAVSVIANTTGQHLVGQAVRYDSAGNSDQILTISTGFQLTLGTDVFWEALYASGVGGFISQVLVNGSTGQVCGPDPCDGPILTPGTWYDLSMQLDYSTDTVTDFVNGVEFNSGSFDSPVTTLNAVAFGMNSAATADGSTASWDNISVVSPSVPEPATWTIMLSGLAFLGVTGWRKAAKGRLAA